jgi:nicotinate-nucleotide adenylyltransferase
MGAGESLTGPMLRVLMTRMFRRGEDTAPVDSPLVERLGVFGGTFDPVHVGHVVVATETRAQLGLDRVLLVVAGDPWQKRGQVVASAADRLELVDVAVDGLEGIEASAIEIERDAPSVTADTLEALTAPDRELFLLLGADAVANMGTWRRLEETRHLATVVVVERAGDVHSEPPGPGWRVQRVSIPRLDIASTDLRLRLREGRPVDGLVPPAVVRTIHHRGLYTDRR